jgi:recombinational DNA repair protein (RecF pathway)
MELKTDGIVLKRHRQGEKDDITFIFTRELGKVMVSSRGTRKLESRLKPVLELFSLNNYFLVKSRKDSKYFTLVQAEPIKMFQNMRLSLRKIGFCYLVVELLNKFTEIEDPHVELFDTARNIMEIVESGDYSNVENIESFFKLKILKYSGYDLVDDAQYFRDKKVDKGIRELIRGIESVPDVKNLDIDYDVIRDVNMLIDGYIIHILGEDISSSKFIMGIKNGKK